MDARLDDILKQYGLYGDTPQGNAPTSSLDANGTSAPVPNAPTADPTQGQNPLSNLQQAVSYAKQLASQAKSSIHAGAQVAANMPGLMGATGISAAQATSPDQPPVIDPTTVANLIKQHESGGNYAAVNHDNPGNTASGAYQYTDPTWGGYAGYRSAALAPRAVQDQRAQADIAASLKKYGGDAFKAIAHHYLPAAADNPAAWSQPYKLPNGQTVPPVADYVRATVANTPLQGQFDAYLRHYAS
jgi:hypothetical protein